MRVSITLLFALFVAAGLLVGCADEAEDDYTDRVAQEHEGDTPEGNVFAMEPVIPVTAGPVAYGTGTGTSFSGYEAHPTRPDSVLEARGLDTTNAALPGLILIHEWWGLNDNMQAMARRLAGEGYRVLAVDLYDGTVADNPDRARGLMEQAMQDEEAALSNLAAAYAHLETVAGSPSVGVMGYCFGGAMALNAGLAMPEDLDAMVIYYGRLNADPDDLERLDMPILGIFGADDESIPEDQVRTFESTLQDLGITSQIHVFEGVGHAFANPSGTNFDAEAAREAWDITTEFLQEHLYEASGTASPQGAAE